MQVHRLIHRHVHAQQEILFAEQAIPIEINRKPATWRSLDRHIGNKPSLQETGTKITHREREAKLRTGRGIHHPTPDQRCRTGNAVQNAFCQAKE